MASCRSAYSAAAIEKKSGYGSSNAFTAVIYYHDWITENDPLRFTASRAGMFSWSQSAAWVDSFGRSEAPNNRDGNFDEFGTLGRYYDVTIGPSTIMSLDMSPMIDRLSIAGAGSQLSIAAPFTLNVLVGTALSAGKLTMSGGTLVSPEFLISGGLLTGNGAIIANPAAGFMTGLCNTGVCVSGGTVAPVGTLTVHGNYTQTGGLLQFELAPNRANGKLAVTGAAALGGTLGVSMTPGLYGTSTSYSILTAGAVSGQFAQFISSPTAFLSLSAPTYTATSVDLTLTRTPFDAVPGLSANQRSVGRALELAYSTTLGGEAATLYANLLAATSTNALSQLSGQVTTGAVLSATQVMNAFLSLTLNPYSGAPGGNPGMLGYARAFAPEQQANPLLRQAADAYAADMPVKAAPPASIAVAGGAWSVWGQGYGGYNKTDGNLVVGSNDTNARTFGFATGADYRVSPATTVGFALAGGELNWSLSQGLGSGKSDVFQAGVYGSHRMGAAYVSAALAYAWYDMSTDRTVTAVGSDVLRASFDAHNIGGRLEGGYRFAMSSWGGVTPYGAVQVQRFRTPNYSEVSGFGNNTFALSYNSNSTTASRFELGSWFDHLFALNHGNAIMLRGRLAWAHDDGNNGAISSVFQTLPGAGFTVNGAAPPQNLALASVGAELRLVNNVSLGARFDGEFSDRAQTYSGTGTVRYRW